MSAPRGLGRRLSAPEEMWEVEPTTSGVTLKHAVCGQVVGTIGERPGQPVTLALIRRLVAGHTCPGAPDA